MSRPQPLHRSECPLFYTLATRWADNDIFGHCNNVAYYSWFDTAVNRYYIEHGGFEPASASIVGYVVSSGCDYFASVSHPTELELGLRVTRMGARSISWEVAVYTPGDDSSRATGRFVHAFVDRRSDQSADIPAPIREAVSRLLVQ